jgi:protein TonB
MHTHATAWKQEKTHYRKRLDVAILIAILFAFCLLGFTEPIQLQRITMEETVIQVIKTPPEIVVPPPPPEIARPKILIASLDESAVEEETIESTTFDPNLMTSVPPPPTSGGFIIFDRAPKPLRMVRPVYPRMARQLEIDSMVTCLVTIDKRGNVLKVMVFDSDNKMFEANAIAALEQWTWEPAEQSGSPVKATVLVPLRFTLKR